MNIVLYAIPGFIFLILVEWLYGLARGRNTYRVHHAQNRIYIDRNYGGIFIFWDRLFGSFQEELPGEPCIYGIRKPLKSYNPFWANVHVYWSVLLDSWHADSWGDKLRVWFKRPGWRPAGLEEHYPVQKTSLENFSMDRGTRISSMAGMAEARGCVRAASRLTADFNFAVDAADLFTGQRPHIGLVNIQGKR